jgi:hypothetical protein
MCIPNEMIMVGKWMYSRLNALFSLVCQHKQMKQKRCETKLVISRLLKTFLGIST